MKLEECSTSTRSASSRVEGGKQQSRASSAEADAVVSQPADEGVSCFHSVLKRQPEVAITGQELLCRVSRFCCVEECRRG